MLNKAYNLTTPQKAIWNTENYYNGTNINNVCGVLTINEPVNFEKLNMAIQLFIKNNDAYRTKFTIKGDKLVQYLDDYTPKNIELLALSSEEELKQLSQKMAETPFKFLDSFLYEFKLFKFPNEHGGFVINNHHIISDSWNLGIMGNEITSYYSQLLNNNSFQPEDKKNYSYIDYIDSEENYKKSNKFQKDKEYWSSLFSTIPEVATIPNQSSTKTTSIKGQRKLFTIDFNLMSKISDYAIKNKISLFNFFVAIYSIYLGRVSNLDDFCIGTPILNRSNYKEKNTCGMFVNVLPLRIKINSNLSFKDFLTQISENSMSLLRHQKYGYEAILEDLRSNNASIPVLYNFVVSYQITKITENEEQVSHTSEWIFNNTIADDIDVHLFDLNDNNFNIAYDYKVEKYTSTEIENIHNRILYIIEQVISEKVHFLKDIDIITPDEKKQLLIDFNNTKITYPHDKTIVQLFEEQVEKHKNETALTFGNCSLTYSELNEKINQLAHFLKANYKITTGDIVGLFIDKSLEMIIGMFAILKAGAAFLPLDFELPIERLHYIVENSNPKLILTDHKLCDSVKKLNVDYLAINLDSSFIYNNNKENLVLSTTPDDLIYIIYTSGSTGKPKGVMVKQRNIVRLVKNPNFLTFKEHENMVQTGTIVFDACIFEIFGALLNGFRLYVLSKDNLMNFSYMKNFIPEKQISIMFLTTGLLNQLINEDPSIFKTVRYLLTGGDIISPKHIAKVTKTCPNTQIINCYGPTENGSYSTCYSIKGNEKDGIIPIGKPISNSTCYVVSKCGALQPIGVPGELWVGGDGVARGYINNPDLTDERFIKNPFANGNVYKTGDCVKWLPDGNLVFLSRLDKQIKLRGFRIELEDIDNNILKYSGIKQSISILTEVNNQKAICSYIVSNTKINIKELKNFLESCLPDYMLPTYITQIENVPLTISGKLDRKALPTPILCKEDIVPARNKIDDCIISKISDLLSISQISINNSFFDIGGDSLSAISLSTYLTNKYGIDISVKDIFNNPTIRSLSDYISKNLSNNLHTSIVPKVEVRNYYPASEAQKRIYYATNRDTSSLLYNISGGLKFDSVPDVNKLESSIKTLIDRHESLRTFFDIVNGDVVQKVEKQINFYLPVERVTDFSTDNLFSSFIQPYNLSKAPLFRIKLVIFDDNSSLLMFDMHHIICDGASLSIFVKELCDLYNGNALSEHPIDYKDFAVFEQAQINTSEYNKSKTFWLNQFKDEIPVLTLPTKGSRPTRQSYNGNNYLFELDETLTNSIMNVAKQNAVTPYMLLLGIYYILLSKYSSQQDIVIGTPVVGRNTEDLQGIIGMFVNSLPLRIKTDSTQNFNVFLEHLKSYCLDAYSHQDYPFNELVNELGLKRDISRNPIFDTMFIYQNNGYIPLSFNGINSNYSIPNLHISKFDLSLEIIPSSSKFNMRIEYCTDLFNEDFIKQFAKHYILILQEVLSNFEIPISKIEIVTPEEKDIILNQFNNTKTIYPRDKSLVELWNEQVKLTPKNTAIVFEDKKLSYKELDEKSNQLAHFLQENGASSGEIIPILMDKSLEMIIAILGILKIGAAFLPVDVQYPKDRIEYMLHDSNAKILVTVPEFIHKSTSNIKALSVELDNITYKTHSTTPINGILYSPDALAYVMYTSGSTGKPKGVMITNRNIVRLAKNNNFIKFEKYERILQTGSIVFDACTFEIWCSLLNGFELYIIKKEELLDASLLKKYLFENKITTLWITAPLFNQLSEDNPEMFKTVNKLLTGGDVLSPKHINAVRKVNPNLTIINGYGPTENTTFSCCFTIDKTYTETIPIGKPISNSTAYIVSTDGNLMPIGVPGELWVGGDGVGKGYLNNSKLTKEKFISNPFGDGIVYKTGDLVKWRPDGTIDFIGRIDNQVKIRGFRVELGEINLQISKFNGIKDSFTVVNNINGEKFICNYFVSDTQIDISSLKSYLKSRLPIYMIPTYFMQLDKLPINANGKVEKKLLPVNFSKVEKQNSLLVAPKNETEEILLAIFKKVLNYNEIGTTDNFFEFGGDSLTAMKVQVECLSNNLPISYGDIFEFLTVEGLANHINSKNKKTTNIFIDEYIKYDKIIANNKISDSMNFEYTPASNVLLTGFTGFLGAHVLDSYIKHETGNIYCLIRKKDDVSAEQRLLNTLHFYFGNSYDNLIGKRIYLVEGDITLNNLGLSQEEYTDLGNKLSTVIHCAALVKHYGNYNAFKKINIDGTQKIVDLCEIFNLRLIHISTISVSGNNLAEGANIENYFGKDVFFDETNFYIGQNLKNSYVHSKFEAERIVLDAISRGLNACILRMGNLTSRFSEGKFQQNHFENAFVNRFKSFIQIGYVPDYMLNLYAEFTPIDYCGDAIIKLATNYNKNYNVFHLLNENHVDLTKLYDTMTKLGIPLKIVSEDKFREILSDLLQDSTKKSYLEGIINDLSADKRLVYESEVKIKSDFSKVALEKLGFKWPVIDERYLRNYFKYLADIGYFNISIN